MQGPLTESSKVCSSLGNRIAIQAHHNPASRLAPHSDIKKDLDVQQHKRVFVSAAEAYQLSKH
eukprot:249956-Pelagomonas_calceolata.AAC.3